MVGGRNCAMTAWGQKEQVQLQGRLVEHRAQMDRVVRARIAEAKLLFPLQPTLGPRLPSHL